MPIGECYVERIRDRRPMFGGTRFGLNRTVCIGTTYYTVECGASDVVRHSTNIPRVSREF